MKNILIFQSDCGLKVNSLIGIIVFNQLFEIVITLMKC